MLGQELFCQAHKRRLRNSAEQVLFVKKEKKKVRNKPNL